MKIAYTILLIFISLVLVTSVNAETIPNIVVNNVYTIPANFSSNNNVLLVAETSDLQEPSNVGWSIVTNPQLGSFKKISSSKWFCYFSKTKDANCGYIPFTGTGAGLRYDVKVTAFSGSDVSPAKSLSVFPKQLELDNTVNTVKPTTAGENYTTLIAAKGPGSVVVKQNPKPKYTIYKAEDLSVFDQGELSQEYGTGYYKLDYKFTQGGKFYIAFEFDTDKGPGGYVDSVEVGGAAATGTLNYDDATDQTAVNLGESYSKDYSIRNPLNQQFDNLSVVVPAGNPIKVELSKPSISSKETIKYKIKLDNIRTGLTINSFFELYSGVGSTKKLLNKVPVNLKIDLSGTAFGGSAPVLVLGNPIWASKEYSLSDNITTELTVSNGGSGDLQISGIEAREGLTTSIVKYDISSQKISTTDAKLTLTLKPTSSGLYTGKIIVKSNGGNKDVFVNIQVYGDLKSEIAALKTSVASKKDQIKTKYGDDVSKTLFTGIDLQLQSAENAADTKQYAEAQQNIEKVKVQLDLLSKLPEPPAGISPLIIIIIIIVVAVVIFIYKKKPFSKKKKTEEFPEEENFEEEAGEEEEDV